MMVHHHYCSTNWFIMECGRVQLVLWQYRDSEWVRNIPNIIDLSLQIVIHYKYEWGLVQSRYPLFQTTTYSRLTEYGTVFCRMLTEPMLTHCGPDEWTGRSSQSCNRSLKWHFDKSRTRRIPWLCWKSKVHHWSCQAGKTRERGYCSVVTVVSLTVRYCHGLIPSDHEVLITDRPKAYSIDIRYCFHYSVTAEICTIW